MKEKKSFALIVKCTNKKTGRALHKLLKELVPSYRAAFDGFYIWETKKKRRSKK